MRPAFQILVWIFGIALPLWADPVAIPSPRVQCDATISRLSDQFTATLSELFPGHELVPISRHIPTVMKVIAPSGEAFVAKTVLANQKEERAALALEAALLSKLPPEHFVSVRGTHQMMSPADSVLPVFWMDYFPDGALAGHLGDLGPHLAPLEMLDIFRQVTVALAILHRHGYGHGDIKPDNFLVKMKDGKVIQVRMSDLGSAARFDNPAGAPTFTPRYLDPNFTPAEIPWSSFKTSLQRRDMDALRISFQEMLLGRFLDKVPRDHLDSVKMTWAKKDYRIHALNKSPQAIDSTVHEVLSTLAWVRFPNPESLLKAMELAEAAIRTGKTEKFYAQGIYPIVRENLSPSQIARTILDSPELYKAYKAGKLGLGFFNQKDRLVRHQLRVGATGRRTYDSP